MNENKLKIIMFSSADSVAGQGVGSAYEEQVKLVKEGAADLFDVEVNKWTEKCDIQHFHTIDPIFYLRMMNKNVLNVAYCHFLPDTLEGSLKFPKWMEDTVSSYVIRFYKSADRLVVVNPSFIDELVKYGLEREKITYIPNFVSHEEFHPLPDETRKADRAEYGLKEDDFVVLGCGQVQTRKGVKDFVEVAKAMPDVQFVWAGGFSFGNITDGYDELKEIMENPPANVHFIGIVDRSKMVNIYNLSDVLFIPSYNELFPMTILEAVNLSRPLVIRDLDLYRDILFDHYLKGENNADFERLLRQLKDDPALYTKQSAESEKLSRFYSREHVLDLWKEFYTSAWKQKQEDLQKGLK